MNFQQFFWENYESLGGGSFADTPALARLACFLLSCGWWLISVCVCWCQRFNHVTPKPYPTFVRYVSVLARSLRCLHRLQAGIQEGEQKTQSTIKEIESNGLTVDAEPADKKEEEKA